MANIKPTAATATNDFVLPLDALVRSLCINRDSDHAFLLGAGASISSGIPDAITCIWEWKRAIFCTSHPGCGEAMDDLASPEVRGRIQRWLDGQGDYPPPGASGEYGFYVERCYPILQDRQQYFQQLVEQAQPSIGYQLLCLLAESEIVKSVWTTNFDGLALRAASASRITPIAVALDTVQRINRPPRRGELLCVSLHGDYRYNALKNTPEELQHLDESLRQALVDHLKDTHLIVIGYSGRDASVMAALTEAYSQPGAGRLYWCGYQEQMPSQHILELLTAARSAGRITHYIPVDGFDNLLIRLALRCLSGDLLKQAHELCSQALENALERGR